MLSETRERFVRAILQHVPIKRVAEVHFFPVIRQGGVESGVAVVAAEQEIVSEEIVAPDGGGAVPVETATTASEAPDEAAPGEPTDGEAEAPAPRFTVYTAHYRLVLKGPDRGKWDAAVVAEADAPLVTVDAVVRGVQRRSGEADEPERMTGDELGAALEATSPR